MKPAPSASHVAVVGGGMLGLTTALRLAQAGRDVAVYEAGPAVGGMTGTASFGDYTWDRFYHVVLLSDLNTRALLRELGIEHRLRFGVSRTGFYTDGSLHAMTTPLEFLRFKPLSFKDKARLAFTIAMAARIRRPERLEKVLAVDWLRRWSGPRVVEKIWLPLLKSKLGDNYRHASAAFIWAIIARLYAAKRSGLKQEKFGVIEGGYAIVVHAMLRKLEELGVQVHTGTPVQTVQNHGDQVMVTTAALGRQAFDQVVMTIAPKPAQAMCPDMHPLAKVRMSSVPYQGVICAALLLRKSLSPYYVTNLTDGELPFTGVIEMTALMGTESFGGNTLVYLPLYLPQDAKQWQMGASEIKSRFLAGLEKMYPEFDPADILDCKISRVRRVLPISTLNYSSKVMPPVQTSMRNVLFINAAQIAYGTLNVNETLALVSKHLEALLAVTHGAPTPRPERDDLREPRVDVSGFGPDSAESGADRDVSDAAMTSATAQPETAAENAAHETTASS